MGGPILMNTENVKPVISVLTRPCTLHNAFLKHIIQALVLDSPQAEDGQLSAALLDKDRLDVNALVTGGVRLAKVVDKAGSGQGVHRREVGGARRVVVVAVD